jgi:hypothetical protein
MQISSILNKYFLLSHHPDLPCFRDDVIVLFNTKICAGCFFAYPTAIIIILLLHPFWSESIGISLFFALLSQLRRVFSNYPMFGNYCRFLGGVALGFGMCGFVWCVKYGQWLQIALLLTGAIIYSLLKILAMAKKIKYVS